MFSKKRAPPLPSVQRTYSWDAAESVTQSIWISVHDWRYNISPSLRSHSFGTWMFDFQGTCASSPLEGVEVSGSIEVLDSSEPPGMLEDYWKKVPTHVEGYGRLSEWQDTALVPTVFTTLFCQAAALEWLFRAFSVAAQSRSGCLSIELQIDCPNNAGGPFWREQWHSEWFRVSSWQVRSQAHLMERQNEA
jgi:hypothetical protein